MYKLLNTNINVHPCPGDTCFYNKNKNAYSGGSRIYERRGRQPQRGAPTYYLANLSPKLHQNEVISGQWGGGARPSPPLPPHIF